MSKHTPGPWFLKREGTICDKSSGHLVATTAYRVTAVDDEDEPNARLIAAAPELLEALQRSLNWLSSYPGGGALGCYDHARAAIAKATGEQS